MSNAFRDDKGIPFTEHHRVLRTVATAHCNVEPPVEHQEELVGVFVDVPHMVTLGMGDTDVVVVHPSNDAGTPDRDKRGQGLVQVDWSVSHAPPLSPEARLGATDTDMDTTPTRR